MTTEVHNTGIRPAQLIELYKIGFKLVPLAGDSTPVIPWTPIYEDPNYWTQERLIQEASKFKNGVATVFGKTHLQDSEGNNLYLHELDIDSKEVYDRLAVITVKGEDRFFIGEMCKLTYVVKTRKKCGVRIFWLSHKQHPPIRTKDCKPGFESK